MQIVRAELRHVESLLLQFNAYRAFYQQEPAPEKARIFLLKNVEEERSIVFIALDDQETVIGFTQLYPRLSSLSMGPYIYISDLYVDTAWRRRGIARKLMNMATEYSIASGAMNIQLETAHSNTPAQGLYHSLGYHFEQEYGTYILSLNARRAMVDVS